MRKYKNKKVEVDGILFDSKAEANRYLYLKTLLRAKKITDLELQKKYEVIPAQYKTYKRYGRGGKQLKDGKVCLERAVIYKADFVYEENGKTLVTITPNIKSRDLFAYLIFAVAGGTVLSYGMVEMFRSLLLNGGDGFFLGFLSAGAGAAILGIIYSMFFGSFQRSVERIKEALRAALRRSE
jgi:hypothetical protein